MNKQLKLVKSRYEDASLYWKPLHDEFEKLEDMYWGKNKYTKNAEQLWKSRAVDNVAFEAVERMVSHSFSGDPKGRFVPAEPSDEYGAMVNNALFNYQWQYPGHNIKIKLRNMGIQTGIFGIAFGKLEWKYEERTKKKVEYSEMEQVETKETYTHCDQPWFTTLYVYDCYPDPSATSIEDMEYFIYDEYVTLDELKRRNKGKFKQYINLGKLEEKLIEKEATQNEYRRNVDRGADATTRKGRVLVRTMLTREKRLSYAPDADVLIEDGDNPYWHGDLPIHMLIDYSYENQLFGRGEIEPIKTMQKALNNVLNQRLDNVRLILNSGFKAKANAKYMHTWKMRPGWIALVDEMDDLQPFNLPDVTGRTFLETSNYFKDSVYRVLGYTDFLTRNETNKEKTATEIRVSAGEQNARMREKEKYIDSFMTRLANQWLELNQQFMTNEKIIRIVGNDARKMIQQKVQEKQQEEMMRIQEMGMEAMPIQPYTETESAGYLEVNPNDLAGKYDYIVESGSLTEVDPSAKAQELSMAIQTLQANEERLRANGVKVNYQPLLEKLLVQLGVKNVDDIFAEMTEQEMQMMQQQAQMANLPRPNRRLTPANIM